MPGRRRRKSIGTHFHQNAGFRRRGSVNDEGSPTGVVVVTAAARDVGQEAAAVVVAEIEHV